MLALLWFKGIGWHTPMKRIGWTYVVLIGTIVVCIWAVWSVRNDLRPPGDG